VKLTQAAPASVLAENRLQSIKAILLATLG